MTGWQPPVSVIVPALDAARCIGGCLEALEKQTHPRQRLEIIVVDNGSSDGTRDEVRVHPVRLVEEGSFRSPYLARNAGVACATGEVLAFTDADCRPAEDWIERGLGALQGQSADLVGGRVCFSLSDPPTLGELTDALWHLDVERQILANHACMTANLLARRRVFDAIGPFDSGARSGGDGRWTRRASDAGFRLVYEPQAVVTKPARRVGPLLGKAYRVGRGLPAALLERDPGRGRIAARVATGVLPPRPSQVRAQIRRRDLAGAEPRLAALWAMTWLLELVRSAGYVHGWLAPQHRRPAAPPGAVRGER